MANFKQHATTGAVVGAGANLVWQLGKMYASTQPPNGFLEMVSRINFAELGLFAVIGAAAASLPDLLEPATSPNHRAIMHSVCCGGAVTYGAFGKHSEKWRPEDRMMARIAAVSYLSHLVLDSTTPKSLPFI